MSDLLLCIYTIWFESPAGIEIVSGLGTSGIHDGKIACVDRVNGRKVSYNGCAGWNCTLEGEPGGPKNVSVSRESHFEWDSGVPEEVQVRFGSSEASRAARERVESRGDGGSGRSAYIMKLCFTCPRQSDRISLLILT